MIPLEQNESFHSWGKSFIQRHEMSVFYNDREYWHIINSLNYNKLETNEHEL